VEIPGDTRAGIEAEPKKKPPTPLITIQKRNREDLKPRIGSWWGNQSVVVVCVIIKGKARDVKKSEKGSSF